MTIKVNYTKEKGLVQELDTSGEGGFFVEGNSIENSVEFVIEDIIANNAINDFNNVNAQRINNDTDFVFITTDGSGVIKYIALPNNIDTYNGKSLKICIVSKVNENDMISIYYAANKNQALSNQDQIIEFIYLKDTNEWKKFNQQ